VADEAPVVTEEAPAVETEEAPEVRELTLTKLGADGADAKLTLGDDKLTIEASEDSPLPEWLRGEIPFEELDIAYIDPARGKRAEEGEEETEETQVSPGFRLSRWIEITKAGTGKAYDRRGSFLCDEGHVDLAVAEPFALTFLRLAGRPLPTEEPAAEAAPAEEIPTGAPEPPVGQATPPVAAEVADETPAFAGSDAFAAPDEDEPEDKAFA
jgi:hypothetical protein